MRLSTAFGVLAQTALLSSAEGWWPFEAAQGKNDISPAKKPLMKRPHMGQRRLFETAKTKGARLKQRHIQQQQQGRQKQRELVRRLQNRREGRLLRNKPGIPHLPNRAEKKCSIDIGILDCGVGEYCEMGVCVSQNGRQSHLNNQSPQPLQEEPSPAYKYCDPASSYYGKDPTGSGFFTCDCSNVDLESGTGIFTCSSPPNYCIDAYNVYCADISLEMNFQNGGPYYTYEYCYDFSSPYEQLYCVSGDSYYSNCSIEINGEVCNSCMTPPGGMGMCPDGSQPTFSAFDCTNVVSITGYSGDMCYPDSQNQYASGLISRLSDAIEQEEYYHPLVLYCAFQDEFGDMQRRNLQNEGSDDDDGFLGDISCDCSGFDFDTYTGRIPCYGEQYCYGPYCYTPSAYVNVPNPKEYISQICYDFSAPYEQTYCLYMNSEDPYNCRMSFDEMYCDTCRIGDATYCPTNSSYIGSFDCTNIGFGTGISCVGEYASPLVQGVSDFDGTLIVVTPDTLRNLVMQLFGIDELSDAELDIWIEATETYIQQYFMNNPAFGVFNIDVEILVVDVIEDDARFRARKLQSEDFVTIVYDQDMNYMQTPDSTLTPEQIAALPFATPASRTDYVQLLQELGLTDVIGSSDVMDGLDDDRKKKRAKRGKKSGKRGKSDKSSKKKPKPYKYSKKTKLESKKHKKGGKRR